MRNLSVLVKPSSHLCNIACQYCFYRDAKKLRQGDNRTLMSEDTLETLVRRAFAFADGTVTFVFQGGEPTLMGIDFYRTFLSLAEQYNTKGCVMKVSIQTNGVLLDEAWLTLLREHHVLVGLSFDGLPQVHDKYRVDRQGTGTSEAALRAIRAMQRAGVEFNVLMVVTRDLARRPRECYRFLKSLGVKYAQIIPALDPYGADKCSQGYSLSRSALQSFLVRLFDMWYDDFLHHKALCITYFENIVYKMMGKPFQNCAMSGMCALEMVVEADGTVYPCDFYVSDEWEMGNLRDKSFEELIASQTASRFLTESVSVGTRCRGCQWLGLCYGSCRRYQLKSGGTYENYYCESYRAFFDHAGGKMKQLADALTK